MHQVFAQAYDNPIPGYNTETVGNLRLFEALAEHEFQLEYFNDGDFAKVLLYQLKWCRGGRRLGRLTHASMLVLRRARRNLQCEVSGDTPSNEQ